MRKLETFILMSRNIRQREGERNIKIFAETLTLFFIYKYTKEKD